MSSRKNKEDSKMLKIYGQPQAKTKDTYFKLTYGVDGDILLIACRENGDTILGGNILKITQDGYLRRMSGVAYAAGIQLDANGRIRQEE